jgi:hypothetical protein
MNKPTTTKTAQMLSITKILTTAHTPHLTTTALVRFLTVTPLSVLLDNPTNVTATLMKVLSALHTSNNLVARFALMKKPPMLTALTCSNSMVLTTAPTLLLRTTALKTPHTAMPHSLLTDKNSHATALLMNATASWNTLEH